MAWSPQRIKAKSFCFTDDGQDCIILYKGPGIKHHLFISDQSLIKNYPADLN